MRRAAIALAVTGVAFLTPAVAKATTCPPYTPLDEYQRADGVAVGTLIEMREVAPPLEPNSPHPPGFPGGPVVEASYRLDRVYKGAGLVAGAVVTNTFRVRSIGNAGVRESLLFYLRNGSLTLTDRGACLAPSVADIDAAARLDRYGPDHSNGQAYCSSTGLTCWSIHARGRDRILRMASYNLLGKPRLCVRATWQPVRCRRVELRLAGDGLRIARVSWRRHFRERGSGLYSVRWMIGNLDDRSTNVRRSERNSSPRLQFQAEA